MVVVIGLVALTLLHEYKACSYMVRPTRCATRWPRSAQREVATSVSVLPEKDLLLLSDLATRSPRKMGDAVIIGRGSQFLLRGAPRTLHISIFAPLDVRIEQVMNLDHSPARGRISSWPVRARLGHAALRRGAQKPARAYRTR